MSRPRGFHFLVSTTEGQNIRTIRHERHHEDIAFYIDLTLASRDYGSWPDSVKAEVRNALIEKSDGNPRHRDQAVRK